MYMSIILNIKPKAKPQGTPSRSNPVWRSYYEWRNAFVIELQNKRLAFEDLPNPFEVRFYSSKGYKKKLLATPKAGKPDFDNLLKGFVDGWFGGFSIINGRKYDDGIIVGGAAFKIASPIDFIEVLPYSFPNNNDLLRAIKAQQSNQ